MAQKLYWITGASSGIGAALAQALARQGHKVAASARSAEKLMQLASVSYGKGRIAPYPLDVTDLRATHETVGKIIEENGDINAAILCAGTYIPDDGRILTDMALADIEAQFRLNVMGTMHAVAALLPAMRGKTPRGQIAITSSVAGYRGLPRAIGYGGSKAALIAIAEALKLDCDGLGIKLQLICPGFVKTPLTDKNTFPMPFLISAEQAARHILAGMERGGFEIVFPWQMAVMMKLLRILPYRLFFPLLRKSTGAGQAG